MFIEVHIILLKEPSLFFNQNTRFCYYELKYTTGLFNNRLHLIEANNLVEYIVYLVQIISIVTFFLRDTWSHAGINKHK